MNLDAAGKTPLIVALKQSQRGGSPSHDALDLLKTDYLLSTLLWRNPALNAS